MSSGAMDTEKRPALKDEKVIGNGSFGVVSQATLVETGETVAVKKVLQDKRFKVNICPISTISVPLRSGAEQRGR